MKNDIIHQKTLKYKFLLKGVGKYLHSNIIVNIFYYLGIIDVFNSECLTQPLIYTLWN